MGHQERARRIKGTVRFDEPAQVGKASESGPGIKTIIRISHPFDHFLSRKPRLEDISRIGSILAAMSSALAFNPSSTPEFSLISAE